GGAPELTIILHANDGDVAYGQAVNISNDHVAILAAPGEAPRLSVNGAAALTVTGRLFMDGVRVSQGDAEGVLVMGGAAWIEQSRIVSNSGGGIVVDGGGTLLLVNSFVGGDVNDVKAVHVVAGTANIIYST